jgi:hypothetical protein
MADCPALLCVHGCLVTCPEPLVTLRLSLGSTRTQCRHCQLVLRYSWSSRQDQSSNLVLQAAVPWLSSGESCAMARLGSRLRSGCGVNAGLHLEVSLVKVIRRMCLWIRTLLNHTAVSCGPRHSTASLTAAALQLTPLFWNSTPLSVGNALCRRLVLPGSGATVSRGIAFFCLDASGRITSILDSPEHPVKLSARGLTVFGPLVQGLAGPMLPVVQDLGR